VISQKQQLLEVEPEMTTVHSIFNKIDMAKFDWESLIEEALNLYDGFPPKILVTRSQPQAHYLSSLTFQKYFTNANNLKEGIILNQLASKRTKISQLNQPAAIIQTGFVIATMILVVSLYLKSSNIL
jgi:hypothetical protein